MPANAGFLKDALSLGVAKPHWSCLASWFRRRRRARRTAQRVPSPKRFEISQIASDVSSILGREVSNNRGNILPVNKAFDKVSATAKTNTSTLNETVRYKVGTIGGLP